MDILRKMFKLNEEDGDQNGKVSKEEILGKDEFRKPQWFEEAETDDELFDDDRKFAFQIFTNPMELQKHFERQMQQIMESMNEFNDDGIKVDKNLKEQFLKPGFEGSILKEFEKHRKSFVDTDLDGEIYADQLHSLMQRLDPNEMKDSNILPSNDNKNARKVQKKIKLTDEEIIMGKLHGTLVDDDDTRPPRLPRPRTDMMTPMTPMIPRGITPFGGVFEGTYQGPKMFSQSVMTKTVRKPDGSYETTKVTHDSQGNKTTTVTRTVNGKTETVTTIDGKDGPKNGNQGSSMRKQSEPEKQVYSNRNIYVTKEGYALPRNLW